LAVDDERVAVEDRARAQAGEVASGAGLAHAEARRPFAPQHGHRVLGDLVVAPEVEDRRNDDAETLRVRRPRDVRLGELFEIDERLDRASVATTALRRPAG